MPKFPDLPPGDRRVPRARPRGRKAAAPLYLHPAAAGTPPRFRRGYDRQFRPDAAYLAAMPDMMAAEHQPLAGRAAQQVGVSNFRLPLRIRGKGGRRQVLETSVTGLVSLEAELKGINMSRIVRSFYDYRNETFTIDTVGRILRSYLRRVGSKAARLRLSFSYPIRQRSLRSGLEGFQYYRAAYEGVMTPAGTFRRFIHFDFVYSSACPAAAELAEHARDRRQAYAVPHSQRSKARLVLEVAPGRPLWLEDVQAACARALQTETQVMVKREDEQAFAELNGTHLKFVEDAARLLYREFDGDRRVKDFQIACSHLESLHSHDAVSVICKGVKAGFQADFMNFSDLVC